jgi:hypothetical protein
MGNDQARMSAGLAVAKLDRRAVVRGWCTLCANRRPLGIGSAAVGGTPVCTDRSREHAVTLAVPIFVGKRY